jgi:hypothetical protein
LSGVRTAIVIAATTLAMPGACSRRAERRTPTVDDPPRPAPAAPRSLSPHYSGPAGFALVFFDDCHCEFDGEDSVHFSRRYAFDEAHATLRIEGMSVMKARADGSFVEVGRSDADLMERLANDGHWVPVDDSGANARRQRPRFPAACRSSGDGSASMGANP